MPRVAQRRLTAPERLTWAPGRLAGGEKLRFRLTALCALCAISICRVLPIELAVRWGGRAGEIFYRVDHIRRRRALRNLKRAYGRGCGMGIRARERLVLDVYRHFGMVIIEYMILLGRRDMQPFSRWMTIENPEVSRNAVEKYGSAIFVTCHGGHFELLGAAVSEQVTHLNAVMKPARNPHLNDLLVRLREKLGMGLIQKFPALRTIVQKIRAGDCVALLVDQRRRNRALMIDFFGQPAATVDTPAVLAYRYNIPILAAFSYRDGGALRYSAYIDDPILPNRNAPRNEDVIRMSQDVNDAIERFVRAHPDQWNWGQPRWKISEKMGQRARQRADSRDWTPLPPTQ